MRIFHALKCQFALIDFKSYNASQFTHINLCMLIHFFSLEESKSWPNSDALNAKKNLKLKTLHHQDDAPNA